MNIRGRMTRDVLHDIRNSLTAIRTCTEILGYDGLNVGERKEFSLMITKEIDRAIEMTQELLEFSSDQKQTLKLQMCSVKEVIEDILPIIRSSFASRNIIIRTNLQYTGTFRVDVGKMKRVFINIAANARDAMPDGGSFLITSRLEDRTVHLEFTDDGCGISPELQARMFDPLVTEGKSNGTGLGMAIVKKILDEHHAKIAVQSAVSKGTTIRISLPAPEES
jgi:signal transduction histidine kinase